MRLKPKDVGKLRAAREAREADWALRVPDFGGVDADAKAFLAAPHRRAGGMVNVALPRDVAASMYARVAHGEILLSHGIKVLFTLQPYEEGGQPFRHVSVSRNGEPKVPVAVRQAILRHLGFSSSDIEWRAAGGHALQASEPYEMPAQSIN